MWGIYAALAFRPGVAKATQISVEFMKTANFPSLRVEPGLRAEAQSVLRDGETLSGLIETAVRETIARRRAQAEFVARGLQAGLDAKRTGRYHPAAAVHDELQSRLEQLGRIPSAAAVRARIQTARPHFRADLLVDREAPKIAEGTERRSRFRRGSE